MKRILPPPPLTLPCRSIHGEWSEVNDSFRGLAHTWRLPFDSSAVCTQRWLEQAHYKDHNKSGILHHGLIRLLYIAVYVELPPSVATHTYIRM